MRMRPARREPSEGSSIDAHPSAPATVGAGWVGLALDALTAAGFDADSYARRRGWGPARLAEGQPRLPWSEMVALWDAAARTTGDPALGLHAAAKLPFQIHGVLGYLLISSATLIEGLSAMVRYQALHLDRHVMSLDDRGDHYAIAVSLPKDPSELAHQVEYTCALLKRACAWVVGSEFRLTRVLFRHGGPARAVEHEQLFECPVEFRQRETALLLDRRVAARPSLYANAQMRASAQAIAERTLTELRSPTWVLRTRRALADELAARRGLHEVARAVGLSARSLQRKLAGEGSSFATVLDHARRERALELILDHGATVGAIASEIGLADARVFTRAFRRWTGSSPGAFRASRSRDADPSSFACPTDGEGLSSHL